MDTETNQEVDRYIYVNNVPQGNVPFISSGLGVNFTGGNVGKSVALIDLIVAGRYLQHVRSTSWDLGLRPALVGMLSVGLVPSKAGTAKTKSEEE